VAVIPIRKKHLAIEQEPVAVPPYDDSALRKELAQVCADLKAVRSENAGLKLQIEQLHKLANVSHETKPVVEWNFKFDRNTDGTIRNVKAAPQGAVHDRSEVSGVLYGKA
jgi:hypothetical protein